MHCLGVSFSQNFLSDATSTFVQLSSLNWPVLYVLTGLIICCVWSYLYNTYSRFHPLYKNMLKLIWARKENQLLIRKYVASYMIMYVHYLVIQSILYTYVSFANIAYIITHTCTGAYTQHMYMCSIYTQIYVHTQII